MNRTRFVLILTFLICIYSCEFLQEPQLTTKNQFSGHQVTQFQSNLQKITKTQQYILHEPIIISSDSDFAEFPGSGTNEDPYRIEGFNISSPDGDLIAISNTKSYFCISNNYLNGLSTAWGGVVLHTVTHGTIKNNLVSNHESQGIAIYTSSNIIVDNNTALNNGLNGIRLEMESDNNLVVNNTVLYNKADGIWVGDSCKHNVIANNFIKESNLSGIYLGYDDGLPYIGSDNNIIFHNIICNNNHGINLERSNDNMIIYNNIFNNSRYAIYLHLFSGNNLIGMNNFIGNNPGSASQAHNDGTDNQFTTNYWDEWTSPDDDSNGIVDTPYNISGLLKTQDRFALTSAITYHDSYVIDGNVKFNDTAAINNWSGDGTSGNPYIIENLIMVDIWGNTLFEIKNTDVHFQLRNSLVAGGTNGIVLSNVTHGHIQNLTIVQSGFRIHSSRNSPLSNNSVYNNFGDGIYLINSSHTNISYNKVFNNQGHGISFESSRDNVVFGNTFFNNGGEGLHLWYSNNNNILNNSVSNNVHWGIYCHQSENNTFAGNVITNNGWSGIIYEYSGNNILTDNTVTNNYWTGIDFILSNNSVFSNNIITNNGDRGIYFENSRNNTLLGNRVSNNNAGIALYLSRNNKLERNTVVNSSWDGIILASSRNNTIIDNVLVNNGLLIRGGQCFGLGECYDTNPTLEDYFQASVQNNSVNGKQLIYWQSIIDRTVPSGAGQVILANCDAVTIINQRISDVFIGILAISSPNLDINNNKIYNTGRTGIEIHNSPNSILLNNFVSNGVNGIALSNSTNSILMKNTISGNTLVGIILDGCQDCNISQNNIQYNWLTGIGLYNSEDSTIYDNQVKNHENGIILFNSVRNTLLGNTISGNSNVGLTLDGCQDCNVSQNYIFNNQFIGIAVFDSGNNTLTTNTISNNAAYGILLGPNSNSTKITWNKFIGNNPFGSSQACDDGNGQNNEFSHNFWDDWINPDADLNGIVDEPYIIDGEAGNSDLHPQTLYIPPRSDDTFKFSSNTIFGIIILLLILSALIASIRKQKAK